MKRVCVFCGSSAGNDPVFVEAARALGSALAERGVELVYGGASVGLMGSLADAVLAAGGHVIGVMPRSLAKREVMHAGLPDLRLVGSMHERKALMAGLSDGFLALPGGIGTLEELFEVWTWAQLGDHHKPCALLNVAGYYDGLLTFLDGVVEREFLRTEHRAMLLVNSEVHALLDQLASYQAPNVEKLIDASER